MLRRVGGTALVLGFSIGILVLPGLASAVGTFGDDDGNTHEADIEAIAALGITKGCNPPDNTLYCPDDPVTRAQMATFLVRALDLAAAASGPFTDISGNTHQADIDALAASGVTRGCNPPANTLYCPDDPVTRAQMATFLVRGFELDAASSGPFTDTSGNTHQADIDALAASGVTRGCNPPDNTLYCPDDPVTRAQMASFLIRAIDLANGDTTTTTTSPTTTSTTSTSPTTTTSTSSTSTSTTMPSSEPYSSGPALPSARDNVSVAIQDDGTGDRLYVMGGRGGATTSSTVWLLGLTDDGWFPRASMPTARRSFVAATVAGKIQVFGGENEGGVVATVDEYEPVDNSWTTLIGNDWPNPRHGPSGGQALLGSDVTVFLTGGDTQSGANNVTPANDSFTLADVPASDPWSTAPADMGTGLLDSGHTVLGDFLYLAGGKTSPTGRVTTFLRYDMVNNTWDTLEDIPGTAREDPALVAHDGLIYIFGGATTAFNSGDAATAAVYDPDTDNWDDLGVTDLSAGRTAAAAVSWKGQIWIIGGFDSSGDTLATVLIYNPADEQVP